MRASIFLGFAYVYEWKWTRLVKNLDFHKRTLWDWLNLLIVPAVLALGGYLFTRSEDRSTQAAAERRAQDDALQAYLDQMSDMLIPNKDQPSLYEAKLDDSLSSVARARTLTVLPRLDGDRKARVIQFLHESGLIAENHQILALRGADLSKVDLFRADLSGADLSEAERGGNYPYLAADDVSVDVSVDQLRAARSLEGATMPNGQKYEDWIKDIEGRKEDGGNG